MKNKRGERMSNQPETITATKQAIITQRCECCGNWIDQRLLVWDLEEDRLMCLTCQKSNT